MYTKSYPGYYFELMINNRFTYTFQLALNHKLLKVGCSHYTSLTMVQQQ